MSAPRPRIGRDHLQHVGAILRDHHPAAPHAVEAIADDMADYYSFVMGERFDPGKWWALVLPVCDRCGGQT